jgi:hypothetical protein
MVDVNAIELLVLDNLASTKKYGHMANRFWSEEKA